MSRDIFAYSAIERFKTGRVLRPITDKYGPLQERASRDALLEAIFLMEIATEQKPHEWVYWYILGDWYQEIGRLEQSLLACQRCIKFRPNDVRSAYALATAYNLLTRAAWVGRDIPAALRVLAYRARDVLDPELAHRELQKTGLDIETAATQAIRWLEYALSLYPNSRSQAQIRNNLQILRRRFPELRSSNKPAHAKERITPVRRFERSWYYLFSIALGIGAFVAACMVTLATPLLGFASGLLGFEWEKVEEFAYHWWPSCVCTGWILAVVAGIILITIGTIGLISQKPRRAPSGESDQGNKERHSWLM